MAGTRGFVAPTGMDYAEAVPRAADLDLSFVELFLDGVNDRERIAAEANELGTLSEVHGVDVVAHLPTGVGIVSPHEHVRDGALLELKTAIEAAGTVGAKRVVFGPVRPSGNEAGGGDGTGDGWNAPLASIRSLAAHADDRGIDLCVRIPFEGLSLGESARRLFEETDASACLDAGRATLAGVEETDQATLLLERGDRITHVHLDDVRPDGDGPGRFGGRATGLPFGAGVVDFDGLLDPVREDWSGTLALAVATDDRGYLAESARRLDDLL